jgi:hypothetical protein
MSSVKHRRSETVADSPRKTGVRAARTSAKAIAAIPVLIRLPHLPLEPSPDEEDAAKLTSNASRMTIPLAPTAVDSPRSDSAAGAAHRALEHVDTVVPRTLAEPAPFIFKASPWTRFRLPRWAIRGGVALMLVAVLVAAFSTIRKSQQADGDAAREPPLTMTMPSEIPDEELAGSSVEAASAPAEAVSQERRTEIAATASESLLPAAAAASSADDVRKEAADPLTEVAAKTDTLGSADAAALAAAKSPIVENPPTDETPELEANEPLTGGPSTDRPLTSEWPRETAATSVEPPRYPVTDPSTFQYPADYHERLQRSAGAAGKKAAQVDGEGLLLNGPAAGGAAAYGGYPSTARLQPRLEPPPVR